MFIQKNEDTGNTIFEAAQGSEDCEFGARFSTTDAGVAAEAAFGRATGDTDKTYVRLKRNDGTDVYLYVDSGTTLTVSATKP